MGQINIGTPINTSLIKCCSCNKGYDIKGNIYENNILICPYCGLKHKIDFTLFDKRIENLKKIDRLNLTVIDIGNTAIDRASTFGAYWTLVDKGNPANASGTITSIEIWANTNLSNCKVATFYVVSGNYLSTRDTYTIGSVTAGSKQTFSGLNLNVQIGDYIGIYFTGGTIEHDTSGGVGVWGKDEPYIPCTNQLFNLWDGEVISLYGTGATAADFTYNGSGTFTYSGSATKSYTYNFNYVSQTGKWSGLGMNIFPSEDSYIETVLANGFTEVRHLVPYNNSGLLADSKAKVIHWVSHGAHVIWGVTSWGTTITSTTWTAFRAAILSAATWAQANGVFEFQLGNEEESHIDGTTITLAQLITNYKALATEVQAIFTNGNISLTLTDGEAGTDAWMYAGKGDIDIIAVNAYLGGTGPFTDAYLNLMGNMINAFGVNGTYLSEFSLSFVSLDSYSTNETVQAARIAQMITDIKDLGITKAIFYDWKNGSTYGVVKTDDTYRLLWGSLLNSGGGSFGYSGSADCSHSIEGYVGSGSFNFSGAGVCYKEVDYIATGSFIYSGEATQSYTFNYSCVASGSLELSGIGIYSVGFSCVASGSYTFSGVGSYSLGFTCTSSGSFIYSGIAEYSYVTEVVNFFYMGTGSFTYSGIAVQVHTRNYLYTGSGELIYSGSAVVELKNFLFMGSGTITFSGNAIYRYKVFWTKVNKVKGDWERVYKE